METLLLSLRNLPLLFFGAQIIALAGCAETQLQAGSALPGLALQAEGSKLMLAWSPRSPLASSVRRGERFDLAASYRSTGGLVTGERVATAQADVTQNAVQFALPDRLRNEPTGNVCLRIVRRNRQSVALRVRGAAGTTADAFRYAPWERVVAVGTQRAEIAAENAAVQRGVNQTMKSLQENRSWQRKRGFNDAADCEGVSSSYTVVRPRGAVERDLQDVESRKQCVYQFSNLPRQFDMDSGNHDAPAILAAKVARLLSGGPDARLGNQLNADVQQHAEALAPNFQPRLDNDRLGITSATTISILGGDGDIDRTSASAIADAYDVCLDEARDQFALAYEAWRLEANFDFQAERTKIIRDECLASFRNGEVLETQLADLEAQSQEFNAKLEMLAAPGVQSIKGESRSLTEIDCVEASAGI